VYRDYESQNPTAKLDHYLDVITARSPSPSTLLDVGCGRGVFLERASHRYPDWDLSGVDVDGDGLAATSGRVPTAAIRPGALDALPFPPSSFDVITAWDVLEHVLDLDSAISEINRCLRDGGLFVMVVPVYDGITGPLIRILDRDPTHIQKESRDFWLTLIADSFRDIEWHGIYRYLLTRSHYLHRPTRALRRATAAIMLSAFRRNL
jgi:ubiquinone/menaquinone biosynthesis C-methylase UbiE